ncbi:MAG TPA: ABC-F family ATP-binding cassette domain-containing protein, partial [Phycisphaerae bacterium]|nr:ABC-F family ATP-binding cassette domain-containing protein [Phycisphaerae bacterium]
MSLIICHDVCKSFALDYVLRDVNLRLSPGLRVGLVGANGEGKTTLLRLLAGITEPTSGQIHLQRGLRVSYLPQDPPEPGDATLWDSMLEAVQEVRQIESELAELNEKLGEAHDEDEKQLLERYGQLQSAFETLGGYSYEKRIEMILDGLRFTQAQRHQPLKQFSGGQRNRAMLATLLAQEPDVLLLDEPTNHLDLESVEWLEEFIKTQRSAVVVVSHDRYFLDAVAESIWEISFARLESYRGNYSDYYTKSRKRYEERLRTYDAQQEYIAKTDAFIRKNLAGQRTKEAQGRRSRLERFIRDEAVDKPNQPRTISLKFSPRRRSGDLVFRASSLQVGYSQDEPLVSVEDLEILRTQRVVIVGANGTGKTTLLKTLLGHIEKLSGRISLGSGVDVGYLSQTHSDLDPARTLLSSFQTRHPSHTAEDVLALLGAVCLGGEVASKRIGELSGGQRSRVVLAELAGAGGNFLILDEPTNHLDLLSREILHQSLDQFDGTILMVSHDRYLIDSLATHVWIVSDGGIHVIIGGWQEYTAWRDGSGKAQASEIDSARSDDTGKLKRKQA